MINLLKKNWLLNKKNIVFGLLSSLFFSLINLDGDKYYTVAIMMCPSLLFSFVVGKMCYLEDSETTQQFLLSLPLTKEMIILEKLILSYLCIVIGCTINMISSMTICIAQKRVFYFNWNIIIIMSIFLIIYNTTYLVLNYKYDYFKTQFTPYILLGAMFILYKFGEDIANFVLQSNLGILMLLLFSFMIGSFFVLKKVATLEK